MSNHDPYSDSPSLLVGFSITKVYSGIGADIVMESITLKPPPQSHFFSTMITNWPSASVLASVPPKPSVSPSTGELSSSQQTTPRIT